MKKQKIISILLFLTLILSTFSSCSYLKALNGDTEGFRSDINLLPPDSEAEDSRSDADFELPDASVENKAIFVQSNSGTYDLDQQMATFILWNKVYSSAYMEYQYTSWGLYEDTNGITTTYSSAAEYGLMYAANYTQNYLREGLTDISEYLSELVAGADAGVKANLKLDEYDEETIAGYNTQMQNIWHSSGFSNTLTYENFLSDYVCEGMTEQDIEDTARLVVMYTKYCNYKKLALDAEATTEELETYIQKNPAGHFVIKYHQYSGATETFMKKLYEACGKTWNAEGTTTEETEEILLSLPVDDFRKLVVESIVEDKLKDLMSNGQFSDYEDKYNEFKPLLLADLKLYVDRDSEKSEVTQGEGFESAEALAEKDYLMIKNAADPTYWETVIANTAGYVASETIAEPDDDADTTPIQDELFYMGAYEVDDIFTVNNNGISYLVKILEKAEDGKSYSVAYATYEDTPYHAIYRALVATYTSSYNIKETSFTYPESITEGSMHGWLCAGEYNEETNHHVFDRLTNEVAHFAVKDSSGKETGKYNVCVISTPMQSNREDKKEITVYGGYLFFDTASEANSALNQLRGLAKFDLWNAFSTLSIVKIIGTGENQTESTTTATVDTALTSSELFDKELREWLFSENRQMDDRAMIRASYGYYVAYFNSRTESWLRTAKDAWVSSTMTDLLAQMVEEGGYAVDAELLNKIPPTTLIH